VDAVAALTAALVAAVAGAVHGLVVHQDARAGLVLRALRAACVSLAMIGIAASLLSTAGSDPQALRPEREVLRQHHR